MRIDGKTVNLYIKTNIGLGMYIYSQHVLKHTYIHNFFILHT